MRNRTRRLGVAFVGIVIGFLLGASPGLAQDQGGQLSASAKSEISLLLRDKMTRTPAQKKIESNLIYAIRLSQGKPIAPGISKLSGVDQGVNNRVVVDIVATVTDSLIDRLTRQGAKILDYNYNYRNVRAEVNLANLETIAAFSDVLAIHRKQGFMTSGNPVSPQWAAIHGLTPGLLPSLKAGFAERAAGVRAKIQGALKSTTLRPSAKSSVNVSEGVVTHKVDQLVSQLGIIGSGVKVGVLSDGVSSLSAVQATGDLGAVTVFPGQAGSGDEGTAMLEIVHDMAPGAQLYFATADNSITSFAQNIQNLRAAGCDIIVDDVFYFVETPFQKGQAPSVISTTNGGIINQAVANVTADGALYFSSAGNSGNLDDGTSGTWEGDFVSDGPVGSPVGNIEPGLIHSFGPADYDPLTGAATEGVITLYWSDPLGGSANDYDLFLLDPPGTHVIAASTDTQDGTQDPFEGFGFSTAIPAGYRCVIVQYSGNGRFLHLSSNRGVLAIQTDGETHGHSATPSQFAFTVAATPAHAAFTSGYPVGPYPGVFTGDNVVEPFSSDGQRRVFFNADGSPITPGDFSSTGGQLLFKPDMTAADGVACAAPGFNPFFGTSAAAPHAAAIAALVKSAAPSFTQAQVANALTSTAIDIMDPGPDRDSGAGILDALAAVQSTGLVTPQAALMVGNVNAAETPDDNGDGGVEPGECGALSVQLVNGNAIVAATGITATLTTSTPGVSIATPTATYPDIPGGGSAFSSLPFLFSLSNTVACPLNVNFRLTVTYTGGPSPQVLSFTVRTGSPPVEIEDTLDSTAPSDAAGLYTATTGIQNVRLSRNGVGSSCGSPKTYPGLLGGTGAREYDAYTFTNCASAPACVKVTLDQDGAGTLLGSAYLGFFDPSNLQTNYAGDAGGSTPTTSFFFNVDAGQTFVVVVTDTAVGDDGRNYALTIDGLCLPCTIYSGTGQCCPVISLSPAVLPNGIAGLPYPGTTITASGGVAPYNFLVTGLPAGMFTILPPGPGTSILLIGTPTYAFSGPITVSGTDSNGCPFSQTYQLTITCDPDNPLQVPITAASDVCALSTGNTASVPSAGVGAAYSWVITSGTITAGAGTNAITYTAGGTGPVEISVIVTQPGGCTLFGNATVNIDALPTGAIGAALVVRPASTGNTAAVVSAGPGATYVWTIQAGTITSGQGTSVITYTAGSSGSVILGVTVTTASGCGATGSGVVEILAGDFDGDLNADILWRNSTSGKNYIWLLTNGVFSGAATVVTDSDPTWKIVGTADFNGDGSQDILWRRDSGEVRVWLMDGNSMLSSVDLPTVTDATWKIVATGDFNNDGQPDIVWRRSSTGQNYIWFMDGTTVTGAANLPTISDPNWQIVGTGDFNGDGHTDIVWRNGSTGQDYLWYLNGTTVTGAANLDLVADTTWKIVGIADYDADGHPDILWRRSSTGQDFIWFMNGTTVTGSSILPTTSDLTWSIVGPK